MWHEQFGQIRYWPTRENRMSLNWFSADFLYHQPPGRELSNDTTDVCLRWPQKVTNFLSKKVGLAYSSHMFFKNVWTIIGTLKVYADVGVKAYKDKIKDAFVSIWNFQQSCTKTFSSFVDQVLIGQLEYIFLPPARS